MNLPRNFTNIINKIFDQILPPCMRDSRAFYMLWKFVYAKKYDADILHFKENYQFYSAEQVKHIYEQTVGIHIARETDLNKECIKKILDDIKGDSVVELGCGRGYLLDKISQKYPNIHIEGVDFIIEDALIKKYPHISFKQGYVENLPYEDNSIDTVICTHVLEHLVDYKAVVQELRRITRKTLIIVTPKQRPYKYTFDLHLNFFPYQYSLVNNIAEKKENFLCLEIKNDWYYIENISQ